MTITRSGHSSVCVMSPGYNLLSLSYSFISLMCSTLRTENTETRGPISKHKLSTTKGTQAHSESQLYAICPPGASNTNSWTCLGLDSEDERREWLQSSLVKPFWDELWGSYLHTRPKTKRGVGYSNIKLIARLLR
jgi:hypothetical protein